MSWWKPAIYDTCSLITLDKLFQERKSIARFFPQRVLALEVALSEDQMYAETAARLRPRIDVCEPPRLADIAAILSAAVLPKSLSEVDKLVFATAVHSKRAVVTGDRRLARAVQEHALEVGDMAVILQELVVDGKLTVSIAEKLLAGLATRQDYVLGIPSPTWDDLKNYKFLR